jgi:hypothetical protein
VRARARRARAATRCSASRLGPLMPGLHTPADTQVHCNLVTRLSVLAGSPHSALSGSHRIHSDRRMSRGLVTHTFLSVITPTWSKRALSGLPCAHPTPKNGASSHTRAQSGPGAVYVRPMRALGPTVLLVLALAPAAEASFTAQPGAARLSQTVTVGGEVEVGNLEYQPAFYVDWRAGACPSSVTAARKLAIGDNTRGLGIAEPFGESQTATMPVRAPVTLEQPRQTVCFYGGDGLLGDHGTITASFALPPRNYGKAVRRWSTAAIAKIRLRGGVHAYPLGWEISLSFKGKRPARGTITCKRKRFFLITSRIKLSADGTLAYTGPVRADNSNNYDHPIPLKYGGHATLRFNAPLAVGRSPLPDPIDGLTGNGFDEPPPLGAWGLPVNRFDAHFSAPGFRPFANQSSCGSRLEALSIPDTPVPVMTGQGTAHMGKSPEDAGVGHAHQNTPPVAGFSTDGQYHSTGQGTGTVRFTSSSVDDDDGIASEVWDFGDGASGSGHEVDHTYSAPGDYNVVLTVTDKSGASDSYTGAVHVD